MNQKENKKYRELYQTIESEVIALPTWSTYECALAHFHYLYDRFLCDQLIDSMESLRLDTSGLKRSYKKAFKAYKKAYRKRMSWKTYMVFDDAFFEAVEKASEAFGEAIGAIREGDETADFCSEELDGALVF